MNAPTDFADDTETGDLALDADSNRLRFRGVVTIEQIAALWSQAEALQSLGSSPQAVEAVDISAVEKMDTAGAWLVKYVAQAHNAPISGASTMAASLLEAVSLSDSRPPAPPPAHPYIRLAQEIGESAARIGHEGKGILSFWGAVLYATGDIIRGRQRMRWHSMVSCARTVGVDALFIVGVMCFVVGIVIAQQSAVQLRGIGFGSFTIDIVARVSFRELGVLMTAIMVAGRSGSSFAAQIGTMNLTEEIDAMRILGIPPMNIAVLPRIFAAAIAMPLLSFFSSITFLMGGGLFCWFYLGVSPAEFVDRIRTIIPLTDIGILFIKAPLFGILIGIVGCYEGMQVRQNTDEVGQRTTSAVVAAIFLIVVLDALFALFFSAIGW